MIEPKRHAPRRYFVDAEGHRVLIGLSLDETAEFEALDLPPMDVGHPSVTANAGAVGGQEVRWLELYDKHDVAWRSWIAQSRSEEARTSNFINYI